MRGVGGKNAAPLMSLMTVFEKACPQYMAMGMSYDQYWYGDVSAHRMYREAQRERILQENRMLWLQGMYIYEALLDVARYNKAFSKAKPAPYRSEPYDLFEEERKKREERERREKYYRLKERVQSFAKAFNEKRKESEPIEEVGDHG